ncbi:ABC-F family ATP-binding cassette domain-containing protein [uncultured Bifidobacterium sp.]|uniref:ABC-F family ATP-binding cassette domain-containing protein n=1 Tax=uncultured Bifidobacterium sp. TaxID=165187 RepID=UPI0028DB4D17|nr:ABC-F family ATP-binding cassette domain-containing protein [uncultured Bifidobacterium sp.]
MPIYDLGLDHVSLAFATTTVFTEVTQGVFEGDRIGIVGRNGDGKSTLLRLLAGRLEPDSGRVTRRGGLTFGMLDQRDPLDDSMTVRQAALEGREDYEWAADPRSREIVESLLGGIDLETRVGTLSGGQRRRADLAHLLLHDWDILALDEPTNHLDIVTIHWLAEHLRSRWSAGQGALLLVTHDRWFLDEVCESMWEVHDGTIEPFEGGYSAYMLQRVERDRQADVREERRRNLARKELAWLARGARARATKQKFHVKQARDLIADVPPMRNRLELRRMATARLGKQVTDLVDVTQIYQDRPAGPVRADDAVPMDGSMQTADDARDADDASRASSAPDGASASGRLSDVVPSPFAEPVVTASVTLTKDEASRAEDAASAPDTSAATTVTVTGRRVLDDVTWLIGPGDRIGIVGANGAGKSTLLRIIDGTLKPTVGRVTIGKTVRFAVLSQRLDELEKLAKYRISEVLSRYKPTYVVDGKEVPVGQLMERLGFSSAQLMTPIADLSGGQKRRMQLLLILLGEPNVLIMDEPGNDLDTDMLAVMEDLLDSWPGTLVVVSHDRYLLERVTDDQYALVGGKVRHLPGGVDEYLRLVDEEARRREAQASSGSSPADPTGRPGERGGDHADGTGSPDSGDRTDDGSKLSGKAFHDAKRRMAAIERRLERLEEDEARLESEMAAHDPSDYVGLGRLNDDLKTARQESSTLESEWMELGEQVE